MQDVAVRQGRHLGVAITQSYRVYSPTSTLRFILTDTKTIVQTPHQIFLVKYDHRNYIKQLERLRELIADGKMGSLADLITYCNLRPGDQYQMKGLEIVPTKLERHI